MVGVFGFIFGLYTTRCAYTLIQLCVWVSVCRLYGIYCWRLVVVHFRFVSMWVHVCVCVLGIECIGIETMHYCLSLTCENCRWTACVWVMEQYIYRLHVTVSVYSVLPTAYGRTQTARLYYFAWSMDDFLHLILLCFFFSFVGFRFDKCCVWQRRCRYSRNVHIVHHRHIDDFWLFQ